MLNGWRLAPSSGFSGTGGSGGGCGGFGTPGGGGGGGPGGGEVGGAAIGLNLPMPESCNEAGPGASGKAVEPGCGSVGTPGRTSVGIRP